MGKFSGFHGKTVCLLLAFIVMITLTVFNTGCEALKGDDDDSDGGSGSVAAPATTTETTTEAKTNEELAAQTASDAQVALAQAAANGTEAAVQQATAPAPAPAPAPAATTTSYPNVGGKGILWKPVSEGNRMLVVLLATYYGNPPVKVLDSSLNAVENGNYVGRTNGNRATYRFRRPGSRFPAPSYLEVGGTIYKVPDPSRRYE